jgi:hypothetical protein
VNVVREREDVAKALRRLKVGAKPICCQRARYVDTVHLGWMNCGEPCYYSLSGKNDWNQY